jgi:hypothetical protein
VSRKIFVGGKSIYRLDHLSHIHNLRSLFSSFQFCPLKISHQHSNKYTPTRHLEMEVSGSREENLNCLHIACERGHVEVVSVLLSAGADLEARDEVSAVGDDELSDESDSDSL